MFSLKDKVLVALSGGADSVALLRILHAAGYFCEAAHCNFHLRGEEADRDEAFAHDLCRELDIPLHTIDFDTKQYATQKSISIEMAARELRYEWFEEIKKNIGAEVVAVGHHKDDSVETILLNLIRGTGINGLLGISPRNGSLVRPLLCVNRDEIIGYLNSIRQHYVTDSTNLQDEYTRNKIRLKLLPLMQKLNPSVRESLIETSDYLNDVAILYNRGIKTGKQRVLSSAGIHIDSLLNEPAPSALLFEILHPLGFNSSQIGDILNVLTGQSGKIFIGKGWKVIKDREFLLLEKEHSVSNASPSFRILKETVAYSVDFCIPKEKNIACFDSDKLGHSVHLRKWQIGDSFIPFGMKGRKKISDYMTDRKFSISKKEDQWVLCCGEQVVWVVGERIDNRFRVDETTQEVTLFRVLFHPTE